MKKYEFTKDRVRTVGGKTLRRIRAVRAIGSIPAGTLGGWLESEANLSHKGEAWVGGDAVVMDRALVAGDAWVGDEAVVAGNARIVGAAWVGGDAPLVDGHAVVADKAIVTDAAYVGGDALVTGNARVEGIAVVGGRALLTGDARVGGNARVSGEACVDAPLPDNAVVTGPAAPGMESKKGKGARRV